MLQKEVFLKGEGDKYLARNKKVLGNKSEVDELYSVYSKYISENMKVLEIGCCNGHNLNYYNQNTGCWVYGIDPSEEAITLGQDLYPDVRLSVGTADELDFPDEYFDCVIFGFCLYLVDRKLLTKAIAEADRVLKNGGYIGITDFDCSIPKKRPYKHYEGIYSYKYDYSKIFLSFPQYSLIEKTNRTAEDAAFMIDSTQRVSTVVLYKNQEQAYYYESDEI